MAVSGRSKPTRIAAEWHDPEHLSLADILRYVEGELVSDDRFGPGEQTVGTHLESCSFCRAKAEVGESAKLHWNQDGLESASRALLRGHRPALWNALVPALTVFRPEIESAPSTARPLVVNTRDAYIGEEFEFSLAVKNDALKGEYLFALLSSDYPTHELRLMAALPRQSLTGSCVFLHAATRLKVEEPRGVQVFHAVVAEHGPATPHFPDEDVSALKILHSNIDAFLSSLLVLPPTRLVCVFEAALRVHGPHTGFQ
jgi:hypothetical protein